MLFYSAILHHFFGLTLMAEENFSLAKAAALPQYTVTILTFLVRRRCCRELIQLQEKKGLLLVFVYRPTSGLPA